MFNLYIHGFNSSIFCFLPNYGTVQIDSYVERVLSYTVSKKPCLTAKIWETWDQLEHCYKFNENRCKIFLKKTIWESYFLSFCSSKVPLAISWLPRDIGLQTEKSDFLTSPTRINWKRPWRFERIRGEHLCLFKMVALSRSLLLRHGSFLILWTTKLAYND